MKVTVKKIMALILAMLLFATSLVSLADETQTGTDDTTVEYSNVVSTSTYSVGTEAVQAVYEMYIAELAAMETYEERYAQLAEWADQDTGLGTLIYAGFVNYYKTTYPGGDVMCVCIPPQAYGTDAHTDTECGWHIDNTVSNRTISSGSVSVSGVMPGNAVLSTISETVPEAAIALFESDNGETTDELVYSGYNLKIMVDGEEWQPEGDVTVSLPSGWTGTEDPAIYVYHFIDTASAIDSSCLNIVSYDAALVEAYPEAAAAAAEAGYSGAVVYEVLSTDNGLASYNAETGYIIFSLDSFSDVVTFAMPSVGGTATSGTMGHLEVEVAASATITIDGVKYTEDLDIVITDTFTVIAEYTDAEGNKSEVTITKGGSSTIAGSTIKYTGTTTGDGSNNGATVELTGSWPTGTKENPVYYTIEVTRTVTFYLKDANGNYIDENGDIVAEEDVEEDGVAVITLPVTISVTTSYWDNEGIGKNECPGVANSSNWSQGYFSNGSGIDVAIAGDAGNLLLTKGKLAITKNITNDSTDTTGFRFYLQYKETENGTQKYVTFTNGEYTGLSDTLTSACYVTVAAGSTVTLMELPVGYYKVTEIQENGYIIANVNDSDTSTNYSTDFIEVTKEESSIPVAVFKNKKLSTDAGISIKKVANIACTPTVSIYAADTNGEPTGDAIWTGQLTANGDTLYLNTTLPAGAYVIVETNNEVSGYACSTSLTGGKTVNGMVFTVEAGNRYDLVVTNTYVNVTTVTVKKMVTGNAGDRSKEFTFTVEYVDKDGTEKTETIALAHEQERTFEVRVGSLFTVEEDSDGYEVEITGNGTIGTDDVRIDSVPSTGATITFTNDLTLTVDTGILLDSVPYVVLLAVVGAGIGFMLIRRRRNREN